jgi:hypothetical protein
MSKITAVTTLVDSQFLRLHTAAVGKARCLRGSPRNLQAVLYISNKQCLLAVYSYLPSMWRVLERTENVRWVSFLAACTQLPCWQTSDLVSNIQSRFLMGFAHWHLLTENSTVCFCAPALINPELSLKALTLSRCAVSNSAGEILFSAVLPVTHTVFKKPFNDTRNSSCQQHMYMLNDCVKFCVTCQSGRKLWSGRKMRAIDNGLL